MAVCFFSSTLLYILLCVSVAGSSPLLAVFDNAVGQGIRQFNGNRALTRLMVLITHTGDYEICLLVSLFFIFLLYRKHMIFTGLYLFLVLYATRPLRTLFKGFLNRERPPVPHLISSGDGSFPSGHLLYATVLACVILYVINIIYKGEKKVLVRMRTFLTIWLLSVGMSRVWLGVHYPSDTLAGFFFGMAWSSLTGALLILFSAAYKDVYKEE